MRLVVIAGPACSGKMPLARKLMAEDPELALVHRDSIRSEIIKPIDEWHITHLMEAQARELLRLKHSVVVAAWNLEPADRKLWGTLANFYRLKIEWLDTREPEVQAMIPPMEDAA